MAFHIGRKVVDHPVRRDCQMIGIGLAVDENHPVLAIVPISRTGIPKRRDVLRALEFAQAAFYRSETLAQHQSFAAVGGSGTREQRCREAAFGEQGGKRFARRGRRGDAHARRRLHAIEVAKESMDAVARGALDHGRRIDQRALAVTDKAREPRGERLGNVGFADCVEHEIEGRQMRVFLGFGVVDRVFDPAIDCAWQQSLERHVARGPRGA